jgi:hypothetical protein
LVRPINPSYFDPSQGYPSHDSLRQLAAFNDNT